MATADEVLIKLNMTFTGDADAKKAEARLKKIDGMTNVATITTKKFGDAGEATTRKVTAGATYTTGQYAQMQGIIGQNVAAIQDYKTTAGGAMSTTTRQTTKTNEALSKSAMLAGRLHTNARHAKKMSWGFTMLSLSMLGVFFSVFGLVNILGKVFGAIINPLKDIDMAAEKLGKAMAFTSMTGVGLTDAFGSMDEVIDRSVLGWKRITALTGILDHALVGLSGVIFGDDDPTFFLAVAAALTEMSNVLAKPEIREALQSIILSFAESAPAFAELIPLMAAMLEIFAPIIPYFLALGAASIILMPILSLLSSVLSWAANIFFLLSAMVSVAEGGILAATITMMGFTAPLWAVVAGVIAVIVALKHLWDIFSSDSPLDTFIGKLEWVWDLLKGIGRVLTTEFLPFAIYDRIVGNPAGTTSGTADSITKSTTQIDMTVIQHDVGTAPDEAAEKIGIEVATAIGS